MIKTVATVSIIFGLTCSKWSERAAAVTPMDCGAPGVDFDVGSSEITPSASSRLLEWFRQPRVAERRTEVILDETTARNETGTDSGSELAQRRLEAVAAALEREGVARTRIRFRDIRVAFPADPKGLFAFERTEAVGHITVFSCPG